MWQVITSLQVAPIFPTEPWYESWRIVSTGVLGIAFLVNTCLVAWTVARMKTASVLKDERDAWMSKAIRLDGENKTLTTEKAALDIALADCRAKTDVSQLVSRMEDMARLIRDHSEMDKAIQQQTIDSISKNTETLISVVKQVEENTVQNRMAFQSVIEGLRAVDLHMMAKAGVRNEAGG